MSLSYTKRARLVTGGAKEVIVDFTADSAYTAGGYTLTAQDYANFSGDIYSTGTGSISSFVSELNTGGAEIVLNRATSKLMYFLGSTEATTTISSKTVRARIGYYPTAVQ